MSWDVHIANRSFLQVQMLVKHAPVKQVLWLPPQIEAHALFGWS
jgi:hypothetical protein